jgi:hypothetical protein
MARKVAILPAVQHYYTATHRQLHEQAVRISVPPAGYRLPRIKQETLYENIH